MNNISISDFSTSLVTDMSYLFDSCNSLISVELSNFDKYELILSTHSFKTLLFLCLNVKVLLTVSISNLLSSTKFAWQSEFKTIEPFNSFVLGSK